MTILNRLILIYREAFSGLPRGAWILSLVVLINRSGSMVLFFMSLYLTKALNYEVTDAGLIITIYGIGAMAGSYIGGWLTDILGSHRVQVSSLFLSGIGYLGLGYIQDIYSIGIMMFFLALVSEALRPANSSAIAMVCEPQIRARGYGLNRLAINVGVTIGPAIGGILATIDYVYLFWADGLTCIAAAAALEYFYQKGHFPQLVPKQTTREKTAGPYQDYTFLWFLLLLFFMGFVFSQIFSTWPLFLDQQNGFSEDYVGFLLAINAIFVAIVEMPIIHRLENKDPVRVMAVGALFFFVGFSILPLDESFLFAAFSVIIWSIGEILIFPIATGFVANRTKTSNLGKYMGLYNFNFSLSIALGPLAGSWVYTELWPDMLWFLIGILGFFVLGGFKILDLSLKKEYKKRGK